MTDAELAAAIRELKPKHNWIAMITGALAIASGVWAATQYIGDIPKRPEYKILTDETMRIRIEQTVTNGRVERIDLSQQRVEKAIERIESKQDETARRRARP